MSVPIFHPLVLSLAALALAFSGGRALAQPSNDNCAQAFPVCPGQFTGSTVGATTDSSATCTVGSPSFNDVWFVYDIGSAGNVEISTCGSSFDTVLSFWDGCPSSGGQEIDGLCDDDGGGCGSGEYLFATASGPARVWIRLAGYDSGDVGNYVLTIEGPACGGSSTPTPTPSPSPTATPPPPANDACAQAFEVCPGSYQGNSAGATLDVTSSCGGETAGAGDVWFVYPIGAAGDFSVNTCGSSFDTVLAVFNGCPTAGGQELGCADNTNLGGTCNATDSGIAGSVDGPATLWIRLSGKGAASGAYQLHVTGPACQGQGTPTPTPTPPPTGPDIDVSPLSMSFTEPGNHPPILVELDYMVGNGKNFRPEQAVIDEIVRTFAAEGFSITIQVDDEIPYDAVLDIVCDATNCGPSTSPEIVAIKNQFFDNRGDPRYYYTIWGENYSINGELSTSSGIADLPGSTCLVTLGSFPGGTGTFAQKVGTFVHEFGHCLGQKHGGADHGNFKPNYLSVMNYFYQLEGLGPALVALGFSASATGFNDFGYSRGLAAPLNENALNEQTGLGLGRAIDWNCNQVVDAGTVVKDIGGEFEGGGNWCPVNGERRILEDYDNWGEIPTFIRRAGRAPAPAGRSETCITAEEAASFRAWLKLTNPSIDLDALQAERAARAAAGSKALATNQRVVTIANRGSQTLNVTGVTTQNPAPWISIAPGPPYAINPGATQDVTVTVEFGLAPTGTTTSRLFLASNDPDEPSVGVDVTVNRTSVGTPTPTPTPGATATPGPTPSGAYLGNISTRGEVRTGNDVMIGGFIIAGTQPKQVVVRALGPTIGAPPFNVAGALANPVLQVFNSSQQSLALVDDWQSSPYAADLQRLGLAPPSASEPGAFLSLSPGGYTAIVTGAGGTQGVSLVEIYDAGGASGLGNISTRLSVGTGDKVMIAGVIVGGTGTRQVLVRALGPTIGAPPFNVPGALADPQLTLLQGQTVIRTNDDWQTGNPEATQIQEKGLAPGNAREPAILVPLAPGAYTAIVSGFGGTTGNALVEVYDAP